LQAVLGKRVLGVSGRKGGGKGRTEGVGNTHASNFCLER
jgi:hypothetical protein